MGPKKVSSTGASGKTVNPRTSVKTTGVIKKTKDPKVVSPKKGTSKTKISNSKGAAANKTYTKVVPPKESLAALTVKDEDVVGAVVECKLPKIADVLIEDTERKIKDSGKWPLLIDPTGNGATFLKYQYTNCLNTLNDRDMSVERLRPALIGAIRYGKPLILDMMDVDHMDIIEVKLNAIQDNLYQDIISKEVMKNERYLSLVRPSDDEVEYDQEKFTDMFLDNFVFVVITKITDVPLDWRKQFYAIKVV